MVSKPVGGVDGGVVRTAWSDLEVQMRAGGIAVHAGVGDVLPGGDKLPLADMDARGGHIGGPRNGRFCRRPCA